jgi:hypothetical protein
MLLDLGFYEINRDFADFIYENIKENYDPDSKILF